MAVKDEAAKKAIAKVTDPTVKKELESAFSKQEEKYKKLETKLSAAKKDIKKIHDSL